MSYTPVLSPHPAPGDDTPFIYRGAFNDVGERTTLRELRHGMATYCDAVFAVDINPGCYARPLRVWVQSPNVHDAFETLYDAAEAIGPSQDQNRTNLFEDVYAECDGPTCWCKEGEFARLYIDSTGKRWHSIEDAILGIAPACEESHIHDGGSHASQTRRNAERRAAAIRHQTYLLEQDVRLRPFRAVLKEYQRII